MARYHDMPLRQLLMPYDFIFDAMLARLPYLFDAAEARRAALRFSRYV